MHLDNGWQDHGAHKIISPGCPEVNCKEVAKMKPRTGVTLVEILIAFLIMTFVCGILYSIMTEANHKRAFTESRALAQREALKIVNLIQSDVSQAKLGTVQVADDGSRMTMKVPVAAKEEKTLSYAIDPPYINRTLDGKKWRVTQVLDSLAISQVPEATGQYVLDVKTRVALEGLRPDQAQTHAQSQMIICREDMASTRDPYWRDVGHIGKFFNTQGSLLAGLKEDANLVVQNFETTVKEIEKMAKDATVGQLEKAKTGLLDSMKNVKSQLKDIDKQLLDMDPEAIFNMGESALGRMWGGATGKTKRLKRKANEIKQALAKMQKNSDMNWQAVKNIAGGDAGALRDTARQMFDGKKELFNAGKQVVDAFDQLKITVTDSDGVDRTVWSPTGHGS
jgi:hypothetical protein